MITEEIVIHSLAYGGDGVGKLADGRTVFVAGTCPGDTVLAGVKESKERFARAVVEELLEASPERVTAPCQEACTGRCGGCPWAHVAYEQQLFWKRRAVADALIRVAKIDEAAVEELVAPCIPSKKQWH